MCDCLLCQDILCLPFWFMGCQKLHLSTGRHGCSGNEREPATGPVAPAGLVAVIAILQTCNMPANEPQNGSITARGREQVGPMLAAAHRHWYSLLWSSMFYSLVTTHSTCPSDNSAITVPQETALPRRMKMNCFHRSPTGALLSCAGLRWSKDLVWARLCWALV